jgi:glycosyltransferase involved in cell wall biosynthesis
VFQVHNRYNQAGGEDTVVRAERTVLLSGKHVVQTMEVQNPAGAAALPALAASPWNVASQRRVSALLERWTPDVAHVHNTWFRLTPSILTAIRRRGVPLVVTVHNYRMACLNGQFFRDGKICEECIGRYPVPGVRFGCYRDSVFQSGIIATSVSLGRARSFWQDAVDRFVAMTPFQRDLLIRIGVQPEKIYVKPHFSADVGTRSEPPSRSDTVVFVGRLGREKGIAGLIDAWREVAPRNLTLVVVGDGPLRAALEASKPPGVQFVGWLSRSSVLERLLSARALLFPSVWYETFGMVLIEAMAAGLPIVASSVGGVPWVVSDERQLVPPGGTWVDRLRVLDDGSYPVDELSTLNRHRFETNFSVDQGLANLERLYRSVLSS